MLSSAMHSHVLRVKLTFPGAFGDGHWAGKRGLHICSAGCPG